jgi:hypothetical protein
MLNKMKDIYRRARRTYKVYKWKNERAVERHEMKMLRKERKLRRRDERRRELMYG